MNSKNGSGHWSEKPTLKKQIWERGPRRCVGSVSSRKDARDGCKKIWNRLRAEEEENTSQASWSWGITREACRVKALGFLTWSLSPLQHRCPPHPPTPGQKAIDILPQDRYRACGRARVALSPVLGLWGFACPNSYLGCRHVHQGLQRCGIETQKSPLLADPVSWLGWISCGFYK